MRTSISPFVGMFLLQSTFRTQLQKSARELFFVLPQCFNSLCFLAAYQRRVLVRYDAGTTAETLQV